MNNPDLGSENIAHLTPLMQQYAVIKKEYQDALVLFQVGDFYELFFDDAKQAASFLGIALTKRGNVNGTPIPLCGVPLHALDHYLVKLVRGGFKVAICDQLEDPVPGKIVERAVTRVLTPGTLTDTKLLDEKSASYLFSFFPAGDTWGLLFGELLTAQLFATTLSHESYKQLEAELHRFFPDEILVPDTKDGKQIQPFFRQQGYFTTFVHHDEQDQEIGGAARGWLSRQFRRETTQALYAHEGLRNATYLFHDYLKKNQQTALEQFKSIHFYQPDDYLILDPATQRNLEVIKNNQDGTAVNTLFGLMDHACTAMGSRMIKKWLVRPLIKRELIEQRLDAVQLFVQDPSAVHQLATAMKEIGDLERVVGRIALRRATLHDYVMLMHALAQLPDIKQVLDQFQSCALLTLLSDRLSDASLYFNLHRLLQSALNDDATKDWIIKKGFDKNLDQLRDLVENSQSKILELEKQEQEKTGIQSLKVRYNQVHGYYLEVTKPNLHLVPDYYQRQQTLVGRERFITPELRVLQGEIMSAQQQIAGHEAAVFERVKEEVLSHLTSLRQMSHTIAQLDALVSFGKIAYHAGYVRPQFNEHHDIVIKQGKHPVVSNRIATHFIPNDTQLTDEQSLWIITGPNMGGKSTYLRQVALISLMAQCGSFVPASQALLPILDRIFTRIGAGDNVAEGKSTFLVEMEETAHICTQATEKSLVILDEVGRGTSTFDGLAIAQAVIEYLYERVRARCLFATHYHELTGLSSQYPGIANYYAASKKTTNGIVFLYKILPGIADGSFGLEVAKLAQLPGAVIERAQQILAALGTQSIGINGLPESGAISQDSQEIAALQEEISGLREKLKRLESIDFDHLSPRQAFDLLWAMKQDNP